MRKGDIRSRYMQLVIILSSNNKIVCLRRVVCKLIAGYNIADDRHKLIHDSTSIITYYILQ